MKQTDTNVFGLLNVTRSILPYMRAARSGVIANISSVGAHTRNPGVGLYCASKRAVSGFSESMYEELKEFGIAVCCVEPGYFRSNFLGGDSKRVTSNLIKDYDGTKVRGGAELMDQVNGKQPGDVKKGCKVIVDALTGGKDGKEEVSMRLVIGGDAYGMIKKHCEETLKNLEDWKEVIFGTDLDEA